MIGAETRDWGFELVGEGKWIVVVEHGDEDGKFCNEKWMRGES